MKTTIYFFVLFIIWGCVDGNHNTNSKSNNTTMSASLNKTSSTQNIVASTTFRCSAIDFLSLKDEKLQTNFFTQLDSIRKAQYPNDDQENEIMIDITSALLNSFLNDIDQSVLSKTKGFAKEYHFNIAPKGYADPKKCKDKISIEFYQENCRYRMTIWNTFLVENDWCSEHQVIYGFEIKNGQIIDFERNEAG